ncbi:MAG: phage terminase small subunit P27 family [Rectinema sp.]
MTGRKVVPIDVKKARGTYRKDRDKKAPKPSPKKPAAPSWLNTRAKQIFNLMVKRLSEIGQASATYTEAIALLSSRMEEVERFDKILNDGEENGYVYKTTNSFGDAILKEHPAVRLREKAARHVHSLLTEFGLTGASAQKVGAQPKEGDKKNEFEEY